MVLAAFGLFFVYQNCGDHIHLEAPYHQASLNPENAENLLPQPPLVTKFSNGIDGYACFSGEGALKCAGSIYNPASSSPGSSVNYVVPFSNTPVKLLDHQVQGLSSGPFHICYLDGGEVFCWGMNDSGQLGNGTYLPRATPSKVLGLAGKAVKIGTGFAHTCALIENGSVQCWGFANMGRLGSGVGPGAVAKPILVKGLEDGSTDLFVGSHQTCVVQNQALKCWGNDIFSSLNMQRMDSQNRPYHIDDPTELPYLDYNAQMKVILSNGGIYVLRGEVLRFWGFKNDNSKALGESMVGAESGVSEIFEPESILASVLYRKGTSNFKINGTEISALSELPTSGPLISGSNGICHFHIDRTIKCMGFDKGQFGMGFPAKPSAVLPLADTFYENPVITGF